MWGSAWAGAESPLSASSSDGSLALGCQSDSSSAALDLGQRQAGPPSDRGEAELEGLAPGLECGASSSELEGLAPGLECHSDDEDGLDVEPSHGWRPGWSAGIWVSSQRPLVAQSQVLVANVFLSLQRLPKTLKGQLRDFFHPASRRLGPAYSIAACLLRVSASRIWRVVTGLRKNGWEPRAIPVSQEAAAPDKGLAPGRDVKVMTTLVRTARSVRTSQGPCKAFQEHLARLEVEGVDMGHKYHNHALFGNTLFLAARWMQAYTASELSAL